MRVRARTTRRRGTGSATTTSGSPGGASSPPSSATRPTPTCPGSASSTSAPARGRSRCSSRTSVTRSRASTCRTGCWPRRVARRPRPGAPSTSGSATPRTRRPTSATTTRSSRATCSGRCRTRPGWPGALLAIVDGIYRSAPAPLSWAVRAAGAIVERRAARIGTHHEYPADAYASLPLARQHDTRAVRALLEAAGLRDIRIRRLAEVERVERAHLDAVSRLADRWTPYLATARVPSTSGPEGPAAA